MQQKHLDGKCGAGIFHVRNATNNLNTAVSKIKIKFYNYNKQQSLLQ